MCEAVENLESRACVNPRKSWWSHLCTGLIVYFLTNLVIVIAVAFEPDYVKPRGTANRSFFDSFARWDGLWYLDIADQGYRYEPNKSSNVAFFPAFPLCGRYLATLTNLPTKVALLVVAQLALAATFVIFAAYLQSRCPAAPAALPGFVLATFGLWPTTFFFRMAYSESLFLLLAVLALYGLQQRWPLVVVVLLAGGASATRPVGIALVPLLVLETCAGQRPQVALSARSAGRCPWAAGVLALS